MYASRLSATTWIIVEYLIMRDYLLKSLNIKKKKDHEKVYVSSGNEVVISRSFE